MQSRQTPLISPAPGTHRELLSHHFGTPGSGEKVYIQAALHADETPAMLTAVALRERLQQLESQSRLRGEIVLVPIANPIGLSQQILGQFLGRFEMGSGHNFNRQFPFLDTVGDLVEHDLGADAVANRNAIRTGLRTLLDARVPLTEFDSLQLALLKLSIDADVVLDLHCSLEANLHIYTSEALWPEVEPLSRYMGAAVSLLATDSGGDAFDEVHSLLWWKLRQRFGDARPVPHASVSVTIELRGQRDVTHDLAQQDADAIIDFLIARGVIAGTPRPLPPLLGGPTPLAGSEQFNAPIGGILVHRAAIGDVIRAGDPLFDIVDPLTGDITTLVSHTDGIFYMRRATRFTYQGAPLGRVTGETVQRTGPLLAA
ncbi:M14 family metallopeptidase [Robbsia sp. Bb-Pol-6]|uniref:M14 family metallopeptidase n=1 Tax=Robbsia betulipollinis TaxID=2981849 RepID=A0ABT3ZT64_9BURK|nr:succinylglutamate desuccinylase/aspartoacylase family protein [Robbsia betulipollinis]MCY0389415.1 M14 family metallopeptidase [Robbsia betulipollinis]